MAMDFPSNPVLDQEFIVGNTLYIWNGYAWISRPMPGMGYVPTDGGIMTGPLILSGDPTLPMQAAPKQYVDNSSGAKVEVDGDTMTGFLTLHADPVDPLHAVPKRYVDALGAGLPTGGTRGQVLAINTSGAPQWGAAADGGNF